MGTFWRKSWAGAALALGLAASVAACDRPGARVAVPEASQPPAISRADLFGDPARSGGRLSPQGDQVAFLAPRDGVVNLWVLPVAAIEEARPLTDVRERGVVWFTWSPDNQTLLYAVDTRGDERMRLFAVGAAAGSAPRDLTPDGASAEVLGVESAAVVVALQQRGQPYADVVRVSLADGSGEVLYRNDAGFTSFVLDRSGALRLGMKPTPAGGQDIRARVGAGWRTLFEIAPEDALASRVLGFEAGGASFLMLDSAGRDRTALMRVDAETGAKTVIGESANADVAAIWLDAATNAPEAFATEYLRREWRALDPEAQADLDYLDRQLSGDFEVVSRSASNARWIVEESGPTTPPRSYIYDRAARRLSLLFRHRPTLEQAPLQPMTPVEIDARDGLTLVTYLTLPIGSDADGDARPSSPAPLVIAPHDGPWARDSFGFNPLHQWLANRGYAVLSVNFRGSLGISKAFVNAGDREWGGRMQEDLLDAAQWAIANGVARPDRIAIVGAGFGGYAVLSGLAASPSPFRCGAAFGAVGNLTAFLDAAPPARRPMLYARVGDPRTPEGRQLLRDRSPALRAAQIERPLLIGLGAYDPRASRADADQIAQTLRARRGVLTYLVFPREGADLARQENRLSYLAVLEHFLGDCLGGRVEPVGAAFEGAEIDVYDGAVNVPGLSAFSRRLAPRRAPGPAPTAEDVAAEEAHATPLEAPVETP